MTLLRQPFTSTGLSTSDGAQDKAQYKRQHIPMSSPDLTLAEIEAVTQVLQTPYLSIGPRLAEFEERFAAYVGARHAIGVCNGTAGLHLGVIAAGVGEGK